ncbi:coelenterazine h 2-monooxygenase-like [Strongylocentrotus purpuratus]|uniref:AB hydrolase-1 domain-containing protein n=1 Tax=Strongylocentrotus purpuratus TaxID=7668 RepID=A0A7M7SWR6_STRPU|nr:coelenterazine h 2-monooxygenase-like [Strongylocentrotus purpuratus]
MAFRSIGSRLQTMLGHKHIASVHLVARVVSRFQSTIPLVTADEWWGKCQKVDVLGEKMSYYDSDTKDSSTSKHAVIFLHGNPTSSYLWRNIIPRVEPIARCLAPDLIGQGRSNKLADHSYRFVDHYRYLSAWFDSVNLPEKVTIVCHDWGSGLGFHWSNEHRDRLEGLVHMESIIQPLPGWELFDDTMREVFQGFRSEAGEEMVLKQNIFVEQILPFAIIRKLRQEEMDAYREPFKNPGEDRRPTLTWPREIPIMGDGPDDMIVRATAYSAFLKESADLPKLCVHATPGFFSDWIEKTTKNWPNHKMVKCEGHHFLQEESPIQIGDYIREFLSGIYK